MRTHPASPSQNFSGTPSGTWRLVAGAPCPSSPWVPELPLRRPRTRPLPLRACSSCSLIVAPKVEIVILSEPGRSATATLDHAEHIGDRAALTFEVPELGIGRAWPESSIQNQPPEVIQDLLPVRPGKTPREGSAKRGLAGIGQHVIAVLEPGPATSASDHRSSGGFRHFQVRRFDQVLRQIQERGRQLNVADQLAGHAEAVTQPTRGRRQIDRSNRLSDPSLRWFPATAGRFCTSCWA